MTDKYVHNVTNGVTTTKDHLPAIMSDITDTQQHTETDTSDSEYESASSSDSENELPTTKSSPPQSQKNTNKSKTIALPDTSPDPLALDLPHKRQRLSREGEFSFQTPIPQPDFHAQLKQWIKATLDAQTNEMNATILVTVTSATQPLLQKIDKLETTISSLESKIKDLKDATSSQANKINKLNNTSEHIKKKLATTTPTNNNIDPNTDKALKNGTQSYAAAATSGITKKQHMPKTGPNTTNTTKNDPPALTTTPSPTAAATTPITIQQRRFFITRNTSTPLSIVQHKAIKDTINQCLRDVSPTDQSLTIVAVRDTLRHNVELLSREDCTAERILQHEKTILAALKKLPDCNTLTIIPNSPWAKVAVHGVDLSFFPDNKLGMEKLQLEIENNNPNIKLKTLPRYLTSPTQRHGKTHSSIVIAVDNTQTAQRIVNKGLYLLTSLLKATQYRPARPIDNCGKCQQFGHHQDVCKSPTKCRLCGQQHDTKDHQCESGDPGCKKGKRCQHTTLKCANCGHPHAANDKQCPYRITRLRHYQQRISANTNNSMADEEEEY